MKYGLSDKQLQEIAGIISSYSQIEQALIFGSRAIDTYKEASDVDIAIKGNKADSKLAAALKDQLEEETYLPFFFDVIAYHSVQSEALKKHIRTKGKSIYRKSLEGWREVKFSDFVQINPQVKLQIGQEYSFVEMKDLNENQKKAYSTQIRKLKGGSKFINDDTLFARITPCLENGKICQVNKLKNKQGFGSTEFLVFREKNSVSSSNFIYYLSRWQKVRSFAELNMSGTSGRQRVSKEAFNELVLALPPLPEQKAIAEVLSSLDDKIELLHRQNKTLEDIGQTIFMEQFGKYQIGDKLPKDWRVGKIGDFVDILSGFAFKSKDFIEGGKFGLVTIKNVQNGVFVEKMKDKLNFVPEKMPDYCNLKTGDILLSLTGNVGRVCHVIGKNYLLNQRVAKLEAKNKTDFSFVYLFFRQKDILNLLEGIASGTAQQNLSPVKTKELKMIVPNGKILDYFAKITNPNIEKILKNKQQINTLENLRDTLLPKLMSGEARVKHSQTIK